ncbi:MAG TPA: acetyl-CoA carboxylase biotin carboxyl carrier protein subunit [Gemmatimonadales bacterium]|jgi:pyruvate carboxylase subunit B|nr:acetyl-CoA carboxylase biotin carboxyl carrier protein subunit [Gemmatimonadales bacterium]
MKYYVDVGGREIAVEVDGGRVTVDGKTYAADLRPVPGTPLCQLVLDDRPATLALKPLGGGRWMAGAAGERRELEVVDERTRYIRSLTAGPARAAGGGLLKAPMPGLVVRVQVEVGQRVEPGSGVLVLEAMKMENELRATGAGVVRAIRVRAGQTVEKGQVLAELEPA